MTSTLDDVIKHLKTNGDSQDDTTQAVEELTKVFRKKFLAEQRDKLDALENARESRRSDPSGPTLTSVIAAPMSLFDDLLGLLNRIALPSLVALGAEFAGFDDYLRSLGVPAMVLKARNAISAAMITIGKVGNFFQDLVDKVKLPVIKVASVVIDVVKPIVKFAGAVGDTINLNFVKPIVKIAGTVVDGAKTFLTLKFVQPILRVAGQVGDFIDLAFVKPIVKFAGVVGDTINLKFVQPIVKIAGQVGDFIDLAFVKPAVKIAGQVGDFIDLAFVKPVVKIAGQVGDFIDLKVVKPTVQFVDKIGDGAKALKTIAFSVGDKLPKLDFTPITEFFDSIKAVKVPAPLQLDLFDDLADGAKAADGVQGASAFSKSMQALKGVKFPEMPDMTKIFGPVQTFLFGAADAAGVRVGGVFGMLAKIAKFPLIRLVGGPVVQGALTLIDGIMGFFKGFNKKKLVYDPRANKMVEEDFSIGTRLLNGIEGFFDGVVKGIVDAFQLFFIDLPSKVIEFFGGDAEWLKNINLWDIVKPLWDFLKGIPKFIFNKEFRDKQITKLTDLITGPDGVIEQIKDFFRNIFDFVPSWSDIKQTLQKLLPPWMRTDADAERENLLEQKAQLEENMARQKNNLQAIADMAGMNVEDLDVRTIGNLASSNKIDYGQALEAQNLINGSTNEMFDAQMKSFVDQLAELDKAEGAALGGKTASQISKQLGHLVKLHPNEVIIPLDKTAEGSALKKLDKILNPSNAQLAMAQSENNSYTNNNSSPVIINNRAGDINTSTNNARSYVATGSTSDTFDLVGSGNVHGF